MNFLDRAISWFSPRTAARRAADRLRLAFVEGLRKYEGASRKGRAKNWRAEQTSANAELYAEAATLRGRSRDLARNNSFARKTLRVIANNVVGSGIQPVFSAETKTGAKQLTKAWRDWAGSTDCDFGKQLNLYGLQKLAMRSVAESGEVLVRVRRRENKHSGVPICLQVIEPDFLDTTRDTFPVNGGERTEQGIIFDADDNRVGYWLFRQHPGDAQTTRGFESVRVSADEILHIYEIERPGQIRGVPFAAATMNRARDFDEYEQAQLIRQKIAACFSVFVTDANEPLPGEANPNGAPLEKVEPGLIEYLPPGKQVAFAAPPAVENYGEYSRTQLQAIAAGNGITYEAMTGDLSKVNFSSARMGWLEFQRQIEDWQWNMIVPMFCEPVFEKFLTAVQVASGREIKGAKASWTPPRREMIDPVSETKGLVEQVRANFISWQEAVRLLGYDPDELFEEVKQDAARWDSAGLMPTVDPRFDTNRKAAETANQNQNDAQTTN